MEWEGVYLEEEVSGHRTRVEKLRINSPWFSWGFPRPGFYHPVPRAGESKTNENSTGRTNTKRSTTRRSLPPRVLLSPCFSPFFPECFHTTPGSKTGRRGWGFSAFFF